MLRSDHRPDGRFVPLAPANGCLIMDFKERSGPCTHSRQKPFCTRSFQNIVLPRRGTVRVDVIDSFWLDLGIAKAKRIHAALHRLPAADRSCDTRY